MRVAQGTVVWGCLFALLGTALACRFNVRDVGFVDLGSQQYRFYCLIDESTPPETATAIKEISAAAFFNTNVEPEVVFAAAAKAADWYQLAGSPVPPAGVLVSPDGSRALALPLVSEGEDIQDTLWTHMEAVFESPTRAVVLTKAVNTYGVIMLVEGNDAAENARVQSMAQSVIKRVQGSLGELEKAIENPPVLHVLSNEEAAAEKVFLWSLGIDAETRTEPIFSVIYGRGRQIGQVLKGSDIEEKRLSNILRTIGLDCECGLDRSWMQGPMMPLKWDSDRQAVVANQLGFDAEDPMIKMEMSQILSKGVQARRARKPDEVDELLADYQVPMPVEKMQETDVIQTSQDSKNTLGYLVLGGVLILVLATGSVILLRSRSQN
ncbi:MAG: hypothetical protein ACI8T1_002734 [Verrucomicrobiales bacterium]|jgi:hypothetical protein